MLLASRALAAGPFFGFGQLFSVCFVGGFPIFASFKLLQVYHLAGVRIRGAVGAFEAVGTFGAGSGPPTFPLAGVGIIGGVVDTFGVDSGPPVFPLAGVGVRVCGALRGCGSQTDGQRDRCVLIVLL